MTQQQSQEERISNLEKEVGELKQKLAEQIAILEEKQERASDVDAALLHQSDMIASNVKRFEKETRESFRSQGAQIRDLAADVEGVKDTQSILIDAARDHKAAIEELHTGQLALQAGQQQILEILLGGKPPRND